MDDAGAGHIEMPLSSIEESIISVLYQFNNRFFDLRFFHLVAITVTDEKSGFIFRIAAQKNPVEAMFDLLSKTDLSAVKAKYVLFDSWFAFPKVIMKVCKHNLNVICMLKRMYRVYYDYKIYAFLNGINTV